MQDEQPGPAEAADDGGADAHSVPAAERDDEPQGLIGPPARPAAAHNERLVQGGEGTAGAAGPASAGVADEAAFTADEPAAKRRRVQDSRPGNKMASMHPRSRYAQREPDFAALAAKHPGFAEFVALRPDGRFRLSTISLTGIAAVTGFETSMPDHRWLEAVAT